MTICTAGELAVMLKAEADAPGEPVLLCAADVASDLVMETGSAEQWVVLGVVTTVIAGFPPGTFALIRHDGETVQVTDSGVIR